MSRGDVYIGPLRSDQDRNRALRRIVNRINEIESSVIHEGDGVASRGGTPVRVQIVGGVIKADRNDLIVQAESGGVDNLDGIEGGSEGQLLILQSFLSNLITVRDNATAGGKAINLHENRDFLMTGLIGDERLLLYKASGQQGWIELGRMSGGDRPPPQLEAIEVTIASGIVAATGLVKMVPESGTADDVDFVTAGNEEGYLTALMVRDTGDTITVKDGTGNVALAGDFIMDNPEDKLTLISIGTDWHEISRSSNTVLALDLALLETGDSILLETGDRMALE